MPPGRILLGDAPLQGCDFDALMPPEWRRELAASAGPPLEVVDFRRTITPSEEMPVRVLEDQRDLSRYVLFDLGPASLLEPISAPPNRFRVTNYDPDALSRTHHPGKHQYLVVRVSRPQGARGPARG